VNKTLGLGCLNRYSFDRLLVSSAALASRPWVGRVRVVGAADVIDALDARQKCPFRRTPSPGQLRSRFLREPASAFYATLPRARVRTRPAIPSTLARQSIGSCHPPRPAPGPGTRTVLRTLRRVRRRRRDRSVGGHVPLPSVRHLRLPLVLVGSRGGMPGLWGRFRGSSGRCRRRHRWSRRGRSGDNGRDPSGSGRRGAPASRRGRHAGRRSG
jgi:hypothetical protein